MTFILTYPNYSKTVLEGMMAPQPYYTRERSFTVGPTFLSVRANMLPACNALLASMANGFYVTGLHVNILKGEVSSQLR